MSEICTVNFAYTPNGKSFIEIKSKWVLEEKYQSDLIQKSNRFFSLFFKPTLKRDGVEGDAAGSLSVDENLNAIKFEIPNVSQDTIKNILDSWNYGMKQTCKVNITGPNNDKFDVSIQSSEYSEKANENFLNSILIDFLSEELKKNIEKSVFNNFNSCTFVVDAQFKILEVETTPLSTQNTETFWVAWQEFLANNDKYRSAFTESKDEHENPKRAPGSLSHYLSVFTKEIVDESSPRYHFLKDSLILAQNLSSMPDFKYLCDDKEEAKAMITQYFRELGVTEQWISPFLGVKAFFGKYEVENNVQEVIWGTFSIIRMLFKFDESWLIDETSKYLKENNLIDIDSSLSQFLKISFQDNKKMLNLFGVPLKFDVDSELYCGIKIANPDEYFKLFGAGAC